MARDRALTSVDAIIEIEGKKIGWVQGISAQETHTLIRIAEFGRFWPAEIERGGGFITGSLALVKILNKPLEAMGLWPSGRDDKVYIEFPPLTLVLKRLVSGLAVKRIEGLYWESRAFNLAVGGAVQENLTWVAIRPVTEDINLNP